MAATAAVFIAAAGMIGFPVRAVVSSVVKERMESVPEAEMKGLNDMVQSQSIAADGFSREYTDSEKERKKALWQAYENGTFPEKVIAHEELLEIIDFQHKMSYAVAQGPQAQAARAESQEKEARLKKTLQDAGGISEDEAVEIAKKQLITDLGDKADELELMMYADGTPGVSLLDASDYTETAFESESKAGVVYEVGFGNPDTHATYGYLIDAVDGSILYTYY